MVLGAPLKLLTIRAANGEIGGYYFLSLIINIDNSFVIHQCKVYKQVIGIPMGTDAGPLSL